MIVKEAMHKLNNAQRAFKYLSSKIDLSDEEDIIVDILVDYMEMINNLKVKDI